MVNLKVERLDDGRIIVSRLYVGDRRKGSGWAKVIRDIDVSKDSGYAFVGDWVGEGSFVKEGDIIALCKADGSWRHPHSTLYLYKVTSGGVEQLGEWDFWTKVQKIKAIQEIKKIIDSLRQKEKSKEEKRGRKRKKKEDIKKLSVAKRRKKSGEKKKEDIKKLSEKAKKELTKILKEMEKYPYPVRIGYHEIKDTINTLIPTLEKEGNVKGLKQILHGEYKEGWFTTVKGAKKKLSATKKLYRKWVSLQKKIIQDIKKHPDKYLIERYAVKNRGFWRLSSKGKMVWMTKGGLYSDWFDSKEFLKPIHEVLTQLEKERRELIKKVANLWKTRSKRAKSVDIAKTAKHVIDIRTAGIKELKAYLKNPGRHDIMGLDTARVDTNREKINDVKIKKLKEGYSVIVNDTYRVKVFPSSVRFAGIGARHGESRKIWYILAKPGKITTDKLSQILGRIGVKYTLKTFDNTFKVPSTFNGSYIVSKPFDEPPNDETVKKHAERVANALSRYQIGSRSKKKTKKSQSKKKTKKSQSKKKTKKKKS